MIGAVFLSRGFYNNDIIKYKLIQCLQSVLACFNAFSQSAYTYLCFYGTVLDPALK